MQFYTVIGAILVAACGLEGARRLNGSVESELVRLRACISLFRYVRSQIDLYALPIGEIFERCDREALLLCGWTAEEPPSTFGELFDCVRIGDKEAEKIIFEFCSDFGKNYREEQLKRCDGCISALERRGECLSGEVPNKKKLNLTLCLCASAALIILLI